MLPKHSVRTRILALAACVAVASPAGASSTDILRDARDGQLDRRYSQAEITDALAAARRVADGRFLAAAMWPQVEVNVLGERPESVAPTASPTASKTPGVQVSAERPNGTARSIAELTLQRLRTGTPRAPADGLPLVVVVLGALGGALLTAGGTVTATRRLRGTKR